MSEHHEKEGWQVPVRLPLIATAGLLAALLAGVVLTGWVYRDRVEPRTQPPAIDFPAPKLETAIVPPGPRKDGPLAPPPPGIGRAMAETAAIGDALWGKARP